MIVLIFKGTVASDIWETLFWPAWIGLVYRKSLFTNTDFQDAHFVYSFISDCPFRKSTNLYLCILVIEQDVLNLYFEETKQT